MVSLRPQSFRNMAKYLCMSLRTCKVCRKLLEQIKQFEQCVTSGGREVARNELRPELGVHGQVTQDITRSFLDCMSQASTIVRTWVRIRLSPLGRTYKDGGPETSAVAHAARQDL